MFIGVGRYELFLPASTSLKDKRQVLRSVTQSVQNKLHLSVAEVDFQDKWQRAALGVTCVAGSMGHCSKVLQEVEKVISRAALDGAEISDRVTTIVSLEDLM
jgi:hypothetical protein